MSHGVTQCVRCGLEFQRSGVGGLCPACVLSAVDSQADMTEMTQAGPYLLTGKLGEGGFGEVFFWRTIRADLERGCR